MTAAKDTDMAIYLRGEKLIGDDYSPEQILRWCAEEEEGYANLGARDQSSYRYVYHRLNWMHGFSALPEGTFPHVLGVGSAYGDEFRPILDRISKITILDPSDQLKVIEIDDVPVSYHKPDTQNAINFADESFDLVTCFGALHHIPNVSFVTSEMGRVLRKGAFALIREPAVSMGDWRRHRAGLTAHERGIPEPLMRNAIESAGLTVTKRTYCDFAPIAKIAKLLKVGGVYNYTWLTQLDAIASQMLAWNVRYQSQNILHKIAPASIFWVCQKR